MEEEGLIKIRGPWKLGGALPIPVVELSRW